ncbi:unnamed protein product (macronuclear) [Paramecium tetraurelia]|uniref:Uncharacterized protein n=1 Tax=Paramecium tetraurelia TaxID=5888 RepID=A0E9A2_PARTE|nr:uncharacterized protein GSPATT00024600001 [Paramecium tetraurelia]CAK91869.1 unnamed protein product [Paramecium tetraurelia]|eukprot:XP_001459266.1 hypothetical protein (macronuclear) [Paramecium tetraurelia strain d4-2]
MNIEITKYIFNKRLLNYRKDTQTKDKQFMIYKSEKFNCKEIDVVQQQQEKNLKKSDRNYKQYEEKVKKMINQRKVMNEDMQKLKQNCKKYQDLSKINYY